MTVHRRNVGGRREWSAPTWADLQELCGASSPAQVGDRCWFASTCYLGRRVVTTADGDKTRWVPEDPRWGRNILANSEVPTGAVSDEGVWTLTSCVYTLQLADLDRSYECLAMSFDCSGGNIILVEMLPDEYPHFIAFRCAYRETIGGANAVGIAMNGLGLGALGDQYGTTPDVGQFVVISSGGAGGGGGDHGAF